MMFPWEFKFRAVYTNQPAAAPWLGCFAAIPATNALA
jgi:hypothetical protein